METKLILVDLDLTLLHSDGSLSQHTVDVFNKCRQQGILTGFSTSRGSTRIKQYADQIQPEVLILNAGGSIYYKNQLIHSECFTLEETNALFDKTYQVLGPHAEITVDTLDDFFWNRKENKSSMYMPEAKFHDCRNFPFPAMKFCVQTDKKDIAEKISAAVKNCSAIAFSDIPWYKFAPETATKENGVKFVSVYLNIPLSQIISFGDDFSDIGMLQTTGTGVAMGNAIPQVLKIADKTTLTCDEDGVAFYLENNILTK